MNKLYTALFALVIASSACNPKLGNGLRKNDLKKDVQLVTDKGTILIR
jgi:hypothetical protein